jgi:hypothetical protein
MLSPEAREKIGPVRIRHRRSAKIAKKDRSGQICEQGAIGTLGATPEETALTAPPNASESDAKEDHLVGATTATSDFVE